MISFAVFSGRVLRNESVSPQCNTIEASLENDFFISGGFVNRVGDPSLIALAQWFALILPGCVRF